MINDGQTITLSIDYKNDESIHGYIFALERRSWFDVIPDYYPRIAVASILFFSLFIYLGWSLLTAAFISLLTAVIVTVLAPLLVYYILLKFFSHYSKNLKSHEDKPIIVSRTFHFDDEGMTGTYDSKTSKKYRWADVVETVETENELFIFPVKLYSDLIPKRVFDSPEELDQLRDFLKLQLGEEKFVKLF